MQKFHTIIPFTLLVSFLLLGNVINAQTCPGQNSRVHNIIIDPISSQIDNYMEYLPLAYTTNPTQRFPVLIYWAGREQIGGSFCDLLSNGLAKIINENRFPEIVQDNGGNPFSYIVIAPQINDPYEPPTPPIDNVAEANAMIDYILFHYGDRVDRARIYMTGFSFGSYLLMDHATSSQANANKVAAIVPVANCFPSNLPNHSTRVANLANEDVHLWGIQCTNDPVCPTSDIQKWVTDVNAMDPGLAKFTSVDACAGNHYAWDLAYEPTFRVDGKNIYEWVIQFSSNFALPVQLKSYNITLKNSTALVEWVTSNESGADRFIIERAGPSLQFHPIAEVPAAGDSRVDKKYSFIDDQLLPGINYYRLSLVNMDGKKDYFEIKKLNNPKSLPGKVSIPNPAKGTLDIYLNLDKRERIHIQLFDLNGRLLKEVKKDFYPGVSENKIDVSTLTHGTYLVKVVGETVSVNRKIIIN